MTAVPEVDHLEHLAHPGRGDRDVEAVHAGDAGGGPRERAEHVDRRALAGAVWSEKAEDLAASDGERDATDGLDLAVGLDEGLDLDCGWVEGIYGAAHGGHCQHA